MIGELVDSYRITRKLGEGGMGVVYEAVHADLGRRVAIKVLLPELSAQPSVVERFFNEARAATAIHDPGIVQIFDFGHHAHGAFIVMELLSGESLEARIHQRQVLPVVDAARIARQVAATLHVAHVANIVHRDLKPENIFLVTDREVPSGERTKILDFGIAKLLGDGAARSSKTRAGSFMGTPDYASPEQCRDAGEVDHRTDIYALGCILYKLTTGRTPFTGHGAGDLIAAHLTQPAPVPSASVPGISAAFDAIVARCLAKTPDQRYPTMAALAEALREISHGNSANEAILASPSAPTQFAPSASTLNSAVGEHGGRTERTRGGRAGLWIGVVAALAVVAVAAAVVLGGGRGKHDASADVQTPAVDAAVAPPPTPEPQPQPPPPPIVAAPTPEPTDASVPVERVDAQPVAKTSRKPRAPRPKDDECFEGICTR